MRAMRRVRFFWKLFLGHAVLLALLWGAAVWTILVELDRYKHAATPALSHPAGIGESTADDPHAPRVARDDPTIRRLLVVTGLAGLLAALGLALGLALLWSRRIARLTAAANALARGDLTTRLEWTGSDEVALLARSLNRMADRLNAQLATIDRQRRTWESLLGHVSEGVVVARDDGRIVLVNPAGARMLRLPTASSVGPVSGGELTVEQWIGQHDLQRLLLPGENAAAPEPPVIEARLDLATPDGVISVLARASNITLPDFAAPHAATRGEETVTGRVLVLTDISELARALRLRSDFVANASHELRTPLAAIRAAVETLMKVDLAAEHDVAPRFIDMVSRHVGRLEALVADLLDLSRVESPGGRFERTVLQLHRMVGDIRERWSQPARERGVQLDCEVGRECTTLTANARLLDLALDNLLDNAVKFTPPGGHVQLRVQCADSSVSLEVRDDGCGIAPEEHERVFERFYQVSPSRSAEGAPAKERGTGLGLSIVKHAVAAMGGAVQLQSELGKGTCVTLTIPASNADAERNAAG